MRKPNYSDEEIVSAGNVIAARGIEVTGWRLSVELKGGNPARHYNVWMKNGGGATAEPEQVMPDSLHAGMESILTRMNAQMRAMFGELHKQLEESANAKVQAAAAEMVSVRDIASQEAAEAVAQIDRLEEAELLATQTIAERTLENKELNTQLQAALVEVAQLKERCSAADVQLAQSRFDNESLQSKVTAIQSELSTVVTSNAVFAQQNADLKKTVEHQTSELLAASKSLMGVQCQRDELADQLAGLRSEMADQLAQLRAELAVKATDAALMAQTIESLNEAAQLSAAQLLDARRAEQAARERETIAAVQASTMERLRNDELLTTQRLRVDLGNVNKSLAKAEAQLEAIGGKGK